MQWLSLLSRNQLDSLSGQSTLKAAAFVLPLFGAALLIYLLISLAKKETNQAFFKNRWFYILLLAVFPLVFVFAKPFDGEVLGFTGEKYQPILPVLAAIPGFLAVGLAGPLAAFIIAALTGLALIFFARQDLSLVLFYPALALVFAFRLNESSENPENPRVTITRLFETAMLALPFWMVYQFGLAFVYRLRDVIAVLTQAIFLWLTHLPEVFAAAACLWLTMKFLNQDWKPNYFMNPPKVKPAYDSVLSRIEALGEGNYEPFSEDANRSAGEKAINDALEGLRKSLQLRTDTQSRLLSLDPSQYSKEGYDNVLSSILKAALTNDASAARLVLFDDNQQTGRQEIRLRVGQGEHARTYAYLDVLILEKIASAETLVLSDIKTDQYFGLTPGTPYPLSLVACQLNGIDSSKGILWIGFEENRWFSDDEIAFYKELAFRATATLSTKDQILKVRTERSWLNEVLNAISDPILVVDTNGQVLYENLSAQNLAQLSPEMVSAVAGKKFIPQMKMVELMQRNQARSEKEKTINLAGNEYRVEVLPVKLEGQETGTIIYLKDNRWLTQVNREKNEFVSNISHDLRSPLKLMIGYTRLIKHIGNLSDQQIHLVNRLESRIEDMKRLVSKVLDLDRLDHESGLMYNTFDFKEMVNETIDMLDIQAQQKKISVHTDFGSIKAPYISADRVLLQQAVFNLIENAIKFSPRGETVLIKAEKDASWLHLSVTDHGKGIAPLDQTRIFNRFFHMDDEQNFENRGQGLGLSIVKSIVEKHGGSISVESRLGAGSIFYLDIPLHRLDGMKKLDRNA